jgi:hypothetical protein
MKTMQMREFLRGGYKTIDEMTLITNHGRPIATWMPQIHAKKRSYTVSYTTSIGVDSKSPHPEPGE